MLVSHTRTVLLACIIAAFATLVTSHDEAILRRVSKQSNETVTSGPLVDLGYALYQGYYDAGFGLNVFKGCAVMV